MTAPTVDFDRTAKIALIGGGPAALVAAIALARRGIRTSVFERDPHPEKAPRFNPDRSYTIDISGHGLKAIRHIDASRSFDERMIAFKGLKIPGGRTEEWTLPGWTGSRGDILRALMAVLEGKYREWIDARVQLPRERRRRRDRRCHIRCRIERGPTKTVRLHHRR